MSLTKVLIVEDDEVTALNLKLSLEKQNYDVIAVATNISEAKEAINNNSPDVIFIDIALQDSHDGIELGEYIHTNSYTPFIYLSAHSSENILADAKRTEPYGYIVKPFDPKSLHTTIQMALYKSKEDMKKASSIDELQSNQSKLEKLLYNKKFSDQNIIKFADGYHLDISLNEIFYKNKKLKLTKKETAFIQLLIAQLDQVVDFNQAVNYIWENKGATENNIRTLVWRLRNKLPTDIIKSSSGHGYYIESSK
jgi:DNA-binding response OmpR family regulator